MVHNQIDSVINQLFVTITYLFKTGLQNILSTFLFVPDFEQGYAESENDIRNILKTMLNRKKWRVKTTDFILRFPIRFYSFLYIRSWFEPRLELLKYKLERFLNLHLRSWENTLLLFFFESSFLRCVTRQLFRQFRSDQFISKLSIIVAVYCL